VRVHLLVESEVQTS